MRGVFLGYPKRRYYTNIVGHDAPDDFESYQDESCAEDAAEKAAAEFDEYDSDYPIAGKGQKLIVIVRGDPDGDRKFEIDGYFDTVYNVDEIEEENEKG